MFLKIFFVASILLLSMFIPAMAMPSDVIQNVGLPGPEPLSLSGVNASVFESIEFYNPFLASGRYHDILNRTGFDESFWQNDTNNWIKAQPPIPGSISR